MNKFTYILKLYVFHKYAQYCFKIPLIYQVDEASKMHFSSLPNLLDDEVPFGNKDEDNVLMYEWGEEYKRLSNDPNSTFQWHDELASGLGGFWAEEAARLSGLLMRLSSLTPLFLCLLSFFILFLCEMKI